MIETPYYRAQLDPRTGALISLKAGPSAKELLGGPANVIVAEDPWIALKDYKMGHTFGADFMAARRLLSLAPAPLTHAEFG